jgi:integrase
MIPISSALMEILLKQKEYLDMLKVLNNSKFVDNNIVFPTFNGTPIDPHNFNRHLEILCKRAGIRIVQSHIFRHTFITMAVRNKMDPRLLKRIVGHSSITVTDTIYTHMNVDDLRDAMNNTKKI